jgi:hypothetical protein
MRKKFIDSANKILNSMLMKTFFSIIISFLFVSHSFSQQDLLPAFPREISYQDERAYFGGVPFTGLLVDEKTNVKWGEFRNGYKNGLFTEYYSNGKKKSQGNFVNGVKIGGHTEWFENGQKEREQNYQNGVLFGKLLEWNIDGSIKTEIELNENDFNSCYYLGLLYYDKGVKQIEAATKIPANESDRYEAELAKSDIWFEKSLPYYEKCFELKPNDSKVLETLKNLYYRLRKIEKYQEVLKKLGR